MAQSLVSSDNGLSPNRPQIITWRKVDKDQCHHMVSPGRDAMMNDL